MCAKTANAKSAKPKARAKRTKAADTPAVPTTLILGTTEAADGDWQQKNLERRLDQVRRLIELRHRHVPRRIVWSKQVHGNKVLPVESATEPDGLIGEGDALITDQPDVLLAIKTADCVPIFIDGGRAVGLAHAGQAGVLKGVLTKTVRKMKREYNIQPKHMAIRFGPHICRSCYRISEANEQLLANYPEAQEFISHRGAHRYFSMLDMLSAQAAALGVEKLSADNRCTYHSSGLFSARRSHGDQRMLSYIMLGSTAPPHA